MMMIPEAGMAEERGEAPHEAGADVDAVDFEAIYAYARQKYAIDYDLSDWADDDTDSGWGYDYFNSYEVLREPERDELVVRDGRLYGFQVAKGKMLVPGEVERAYEGSITKRYGDQQVWRLLRAS